MHFKHKFNLEFLWTLMQKITFLELFAKDGKSNNVTVNPTILTRIITRTCLLDFLARLTKCLRKRKIIKEMYKEQNSDATIKSIMSIKWFIPQPNEIMTNRKISLFSWFFSAASNWTKHHDDSFSTFLMLYGLYCSMMSVRMIPLNFFCVQ